MEQFYRPSELKLGNLSANDKLVVQAEPCRRCSKRGTCLKLKLESGALSRLPEPQGNALGPYMSNRSFPAEHPFASHISKAALFPKFDSDVDPKRGLAAARATKIISNDMPANGYKFTVIHKIKGFEDRRELQVIPNSSERTALEFVGEQGFHQVHNGQQMFYPMPQKTLAPNLQSRGADLKVSLRTANALRDIERDQWQTTYNRNHTGLGPQNPNQLDNIESKAYVYATYGITNELLYPKTINTFNPPRPFEGRIAKTLIPKPQPMKTAEAANKAVNPNYLRMKTLSEKEEDRLLHGKEYVSLPEIKEDKTKARWREIQEMAHPDANLQIVDEAQSEPEDIPYKPAGTETNCLVEPPGGSSAQYPDYPDYPKRVQDQRYQENEANTRLNVLELHTPSHDIAALRLKMDLAKANEMPRTFYSHEGKYNEQRAGLCKTLYSSEKLAYNLNAMQVSGPEIMNTMHSHVNSINFPTSLNHDMSNPLHYYSTEGYSLPNLSCDRREAREIVEHNLALKEGQKQMLTPSVETARVRVREGETVNKESVMDDAHEFLQDHNIGAFCRFEPLAVISRENKHLHHLPLALSSKLKSVIFADNIMVANSLEDGRFRFSSVPVNSSPRPITEPAPMSVNGPLITTQYTSRQAQYQPENDHIDEELQIESEDPHTKSMCPNVESNTDEQLIIANSSVLRKRPASSDPSSEYQNEFGSKGTAFIPSNIPHCMSFESSCKAQLPTYHIGYKTNERFEWLPGLGAPRQHTSLLVLQNSFDKSAERKKFFSQFPECHPDLRENITKGRKHYFCGGINSQVIHG